MRAGEKVQSAQWAMLASLGEARVEVCRQPRVAILTTGDELVEVGAELLPGQIRDSNSFALDGMVQSCGGVVVARRHLRDDARALREALLECARNCDVIITSGGVSMGDFDPVRDVLPTVAGVHFWKIAMKPGKPVMFATMRASNSSENEANADEANADSGVDFAVDSGRDFSMRGAISPPHEYSCGGHVPVFGLPGNPVSVMVAFEQFVRPCLLAMQNRKARRRVTLQARVLSGFSSPPNRVEWVRALVLPDESSDVHNDVIGTNRWSARVAGDQGSGRLSSMTGANALLLVPADVARVESGDFLSAQMTDWPEIE
jgi:molybdopterin molybdotransferase